MTSFGFVFLFILFIWVLCFYFSAWWGSGWRCCQATVRRRYGDRTPTLREYENTGMRRWETRWRDERRQYDWRPDTEAHEAHSACCPVHLKLGEGYGMPGCALPPIASHGSQPVTARVYCPNARQGGVIGGEKNGGLPHRTKMTHSSSCQTAV